MNNSLLIFSSLHTPRLRYVLEWIGTECLGITCRLTADETEWQQWTGPKLVYDTHFKPEAALCILPHGLLAEDTIRSVPLAVQRWRKSTVLFYNQPGSQVPFDLFAAVFYLISRYEEYLPFIPDHHGRFPASASAACQYRFLEQPVIDEWLMGFREVLKQQFDLTFTLLPFQHQVSFDVDIAWHYLHKGLWRNLGGALKDIVSGNFFAVKERLAVLSGKQKDPFDCFDQLLQYAGAVTPLFFFLLGSGSKYDKNINPDHPEMSSLLRKIAAQYPVGIHPSYLSHTHTTILHQEIATLTGITGMPVQHSRQHYLKLRLPVTYRQLIEAGVPNDYSMGFPDQNGFRAGTAQSFLWYDLDREAVTTLRIHPFAFMDATAWFYKKYNPEAAFAEWERLYLAVKRTGGKLTTIWHNHLLGTDKTGQKRNVFFQRTLSYGS